MTSFLRFFGFALLIAAIVSSLNVVGSATAGADHPVALRVQTLTVPPSTQPVMQIDVCNLTDAQYTGTIALQGPAGWQLSPAKRVVTLAAGETRSVPFSIDQGRNVATNQYTFEVTATNDLGETVHRQTTFVASAPYFKPTIDGYGDEWKDAIPITFESGGKATIIRTYWNRRQFSLLIAVQERRLVFLGGDPSSTPPDAVQIAISPLNREADAAAGETADRYEFLVAATADGAKCFQLASMDTALGELRQSRQLEQLAYEDADVIVRRDGDTTVYECSFSFAPMRNEIRPMEGREFFMSVLVHDPDDTGLRDLGQAAGLWASPDDAEAWRHWDGGSWDEASPRGNKVHWGLCTSKY